LFYTSLPSFLPLLPHCFIVLYLSSLLLDLLTIKSKRNKLIFRHTCQLTDLYVLYRRTFRTSACFNQMNRDE
jgi:hypothetical protein